jgi:nucleoside-diphosphate-sugar epimerase
MTFMKSNHRSFDIRTEPYLYYPWTVRSPGRSDALGGILVTGATSFIGIHVIRELQRLTNRTIHCLVRAGSHDDARRRLIAITERWKVEGIDYDRLDLHCGDVLKPNWGLPEPEWRCVQERSSVVVHLALHARYDLPYARYQRTWLPELISMIEYCRNESFPKSLHYPCSYNSHFLRVDEDFGRLDTSAWHCGYTGFKWVAERLIRHNLGAELRGCLYDIPLVFGTMESAISPPQYAAWHLITMMIQTGVVPDFVFQLITVDSLARCMVNNILAHGQGRGLRYIRPILDGQVLPKHLIAVLKDAGYETQMGSREDIINRSSSPRLSAFLLPQDFTALISDAHSLPAILPVDMQFDSMPGATDAFERNVSHWIAMKHSQA